MIDPRILKKLRKLLALADSPEPHEAAAALRQAQALMDKYGLRAEDAEATGACVEGRRTTRKKPTNWQKKLAFVVAKAWQCQAIWICVSGLKASVRFVGCHHKPTAAAYTWDVLFRRLARERGAYLRALSRRLVPGTRTRRADLFAEGWIARVAAEAERFGGSVPDAEQRAIDAYMQTNGVEVRTMKSRGKRIRQGDRDALVAGVRAGSDVRLHHGIGQQSQPMIEH